MFGNSVFSDGSLAASNASNVAFKRRSGCRSMAGSAVLRFSNKVMASSMVRAVSPSLAT